jgi:hypothetical protein
MVGGHGEGDRFALQRSELHPRPRAAGQGDEGKVESPTVHIVCHFA